MSEHDRVKILSTVRTPIGFFALVILIVESLALLVATRYEEASSIPLVWGVFALLLATIVFVFSALIKHPELFTAAAKSEYQSVDSSSASIDVFLSIPMSGMDEEEYKLYRMAALDIKNALIKYCGAANVYNPTDSIPSTNDFEDHSLTLRKEFEVLKNCKTFVAVYPKKVATSLLVEIGYALAMGKETIIFCKRKDLPFILVEADKVYGNVRIYEVTEPNKIVEYMKANGNGFV